VVIAVPAVVFMWLVVLVNLDAGPGTAALLALLAAGGTVAVVREALR
jgi:hypothetical protein